MISGISSSLAGLFAFSQKLSNTANNVANSNTDGYKKSVAHIVEDKKGLPQVLLEKTNTPGLMIQEPEGVTRALSNVELASEFPQMMISQRGYEANIKTLETEEEMIGTIIDIVG